MKRHPEIAERVSQRDDILRERHRAVDVITAAGLTAGLLAKKMDCVKEIETEERVVRMLEDATAIFRDYLRHKLKAYEDELRKKEAHQHTALSRGDELLKAARDESYKRGIQ